MVGMAKGALRVDGKVRNNVLHECGQKSEGHTWSLALPVIEAMPD
jgi:hypothetical protein